MTLVYAAWLSRFTFCVCASSSESYMHSSRWKLGTSSLGATRKGVILSKGWERGKINSFWLDGQANDVFLSKEGTQGGPACCQHLLIPNADSESWFTGTQGMSQDLSFSFVRWKRRSEMNFKMRFQQSLSLHELWINLSQMTVNWDKKNSIRHKSPLSNSEKWLCFDYL